MLEATSLEQPPGGQRIVPNLRHVPLPCDLEGTPAVSAPALAMEQVLLHPSLGISQRSV